MKIDPQHPLISLRNVATVFRGNDPLVDCQSAHHYPTQFAQKNEKSEHVIALSEIDKIISFSQDSIKETGINPLCLAKGTITWPLKSREVQSPLFLFDVSFEVDKVNKQVKLQLDESEWNLNPYVEKTLRDSYDIVLLESPDIESQFEQLISKGFTINPGFESLGNYHPHRYETIQELDAIVAASRLSPPLSELLGGTSSQQETLHFSSANLLEADPDQRQLLDAFKTNNIVIQGPPGTGKSQILTNFIGKLLELDASMLVISEKRTALEVLEKKLAQLGLRPFIYLATADQNTHHFIQELKDTWQYFETQQVEAPSHVFMFDTLMGNLQYTLDLLAQPHFGGLTFAEFDSYSKGTDLSNGIYLANPPELTAFKKHESLLAKLYQEKVQVAAASIRSQVFDVKQFDELATRLTTWVSMLSAHKNWLHENCTLANLDVLQRKMHSCQVLINTSKQAYFPILEPDTKLQAQFHKLLVKYHKLNADHASDQRILAGWNRVPSLLELDGLETDANQTGWWNRRRSNQQWQKLTSIPVDKRPHFIQETRQALKREENRQKLVGQFARIGVLDIDREVPQIVSLLSTVNSDVWALFHATTAAERSSFADGYSHVKQIRSEIKLYLQVGEHEELLSLFQDLQRSLGLLLPHLSKLRELSTSLRRSLIQFSSFTALKDALICTHWSKFQLAYPALSQFNMGELHEKLKQLQHHEKLDQEGLIHQIKYTYFAKFNAYHALLNTPASKLSEDQKVLKQQLKRGKSLLVKEFGKSRQHPSLRHLFQTEAALWLRILKPVWMSHPFQVATNFPVQTDLFDVCLIDEASQMPLHHAVGSIQRSKRVLIAGDEHQMGPSHYFTRTDNEQVSVLHHASYYFKQAMLKHHYRSQHPSLIAFSNAHFYQNKLHVFPTYPVEEQVIYRHFLPDARYENRVNFDEATKVCACIEQALTSNQTIGIVAFSLEQVSAIRNTLSPKTALLLNEAIDAGRVFLKPLDKVQGDECEHLIISLGYGKQADGIFRHTLGPLATESGRNRLNVLLTRASKRIDFFCSLQSSDIRPTDNESINLLRQWLHFTEQITDFKYTFPHGFQHVKKNVLLCAHPQNTIQNAYQLYTDYTVLSNRGWDIQFS